MNQKPSEHRLARLDPDRAAAGRPPSQAEKQPPFDPRRHQLLIGLIALALVIAFSVYRFTDHGVSTAGVPAGKRFAAFAAPLATSTLVGDANLQPPCTARGHDPRALNVCLLLAREPLVLGFFVPATSCTRAIDAMQVTSRSPVGRGVQFAAVAVHSNRQAAAAAVLKRGWTMPVAYDPDGAVAQRYGIVVCPLVELIHRGGVVSQRLIGNHWASPAVLAAQVSRLVP